MNILLWTQENKLSEKFYKKLGFELVRSNDEISVMSLNGFEVWLVNMRDEDMFVGDALAKDKGKGMYIYIQTEDVGTKYQHLIKNGITPATEPKDWRWGNREFIVKDPDGYKLCFWQKI